MAKKIKSIEEINGVGKELYLTVKNINISDEDLDDLIAVFYRYKIDMKQLGVFLNSRNKSWFYDNKKAFWHKKVFAV